MNWDEGCNNPSYTPEDAGLYPSIYEGGFKNLFPSHGSYPDPTTYSKIFTAPPDRFKFYVPTGIWRLMVYFYNSDEAKAGVAMRFGIPPQLNYCGVRINTFSIMPWKQDNGGKIEAAAMADWQVATGGGMFVPVFEIWGTPLVKGGWLYFKNLTVSGDIKSVRQVFMADKTKYAEWYNTAKWNANGDPTDGAAPTPQPQPQPEPEPTPTPTPDPIPGPIFVTVTVNDSAMTTKLPLNIEVK